MARSAESLYDAMDEPQRGRLRGLLLRLVVPTDDGDAVRVRVPRASVAVDEDHARLVEQLVEARLVGIDGDTVEIAHEALVRVWPRLRGWLDEDTEGQRIRRRAHSATTSATTRRSSPVSGTRAAPVARARSTACSHASRVRITSLR